MLKSLISAALISITAATAASALESVTLACVTKNPSSRDWVPKVVFVQINQRTVTAAVLDEYTTAAMDGPAMAEIKLTGKDRWQLKWSLVGIRDRMDKVQNVNFKMTINTRTGSFNYNGLGESFFVVPGSASGTCKAVKPES
jgi:hypothetical protein